MLATRAGWIGRVEVAEVVFDPSVVSYEELLDRAAAHECAEPVFARSDAQLRAARARPGLDVERSDAAVRDVDDDKYYLGQSWARFVPATVAQRTRMNARVEDLGRWLSPRQQALLAVIEAHPDAGWPVPKGEDLREDWDRAQAKVAEIQGRAADR